MNNIRGSILKTSRKTNGNAQCNVRERSRTLFKVDASDRILYSSISFARDKAKLIKQLIPMARRESEKEREGERERKLRPRARGSVFWNRGGVRENKRGPPLGNQRCGRTGDFQFADSLRARYSWRRHSAPPRRGHVVPLRCAEYVSPHTLSAAALTGKEKKSGVVQSKINRPAGPVGLIGLEI